jgi:hypothetical protein
MTDDAPALKLFEGSGRNLGDSLPALDGAMKRRPCQGLVCHLLWDGPQRVNLGGPEPVLPIGLPCELHSSPD